MSTIDVPRPHRTVSLRRARSRYGDQRGLGIEVGLQQEAGVEKRGCSAAGGSVSKTSLLLRTAPSLEAVEGLAQVGQTVPRLAPGRRIAAPCAAPRMARAIEGAWRFSLTSCTGSSRPLLRQRRTAAVLCRRSPRPVFPEDVKRFQSARSGGGRGPSGPQAP